MKPDWTVADIRPFVLDTIEIVGIDRCMFASNFPVDSLCADFDTIMGGFEAIVAGRPSADQRSLFLMLLVYWALLTLGPLLIGASLSLSSYGFAMVEWSGIDGYTRSFFNVTQFLPAVLSRQNDQSDFHRPTHATEETQTEGIRPIRASRNSSVKDLPTAGVSCHRVAFQTDPRHPLL